MFLNGIAGWQWVEEWTTSKKDVQHMKEYEDEYK